MVWNHRLFAKDNLVCVFCLHISAVLRFPKNMVVDFVCVELVMIKIKLFTVRYDLASYLKTVFNHSHERSSKERMEIIKNSHGNYDVWLHIQKIRFDFVPTKFD